MISAQKRCISLFLVLILMLGMVPAAYATETEPTIVTEPGESAESPTESITEETTLPEEPPPTEEITIPTETAEDPTFSVMAANEGIATIDESVITGAPSAFANLTLPSGGIDIPAQGYLQHKTKLPLYSVYLKNQPGYETNYYVAYCIEPGVALGNSGGHTGTPYYLAGMSDGEGALYSLTRDQVKAIGIALLYGQQEIARKADEESYRRWKLCRHAATQAIVWEIACGWRSPYPPYTLWDTTLYDAITPSLYCATSVWGTNFYLDGMDDAYLEIAEQMAQHYTIPSFMDSSKSSADTYTLTLDSTGKYSITLTDSNNILSQFSFTNTSELTFSVSGNKLTITANAPLSLRTIATSKQVPSLDDQAFYVWEYRAQQKLMSCVAEPSNTAMTAYLSVTAPDVTCSIDLTKTTEDGKNLSGWQFGIYSDSACTNLISGPYTTDSSGKIPTITRLTAQTVYIKELGNTDSTIAALYTCSSANPQKVMLTAGGTSTVTFHNKLNSGGAKIVKVTNTGLNLSGWKIGIYTDADCSNAVSGSPFTTGQDGTVSVTGLTPGRYYAREESSADSYWVCDTAVKTIDVAANKTTTVTFENVHYGKIQILKTMIGDGSVEGWSFKVTDADGTEISGSPFTTTSAGTIVTENLLPGVYTIEEIIPEDSPYYCQSQNPQTVTVVQGQTAEVTFTNAMKTGSITVHKVDTRREPLTGATFLLEWSADGTQWEPVHYVADNSMERGGCSSETLEDGCLTSGSDGIIVWKNLHPDLFYRVTELSAPEGYELLKEPAFEGKLPVDSLEVSFQVVNVHGFTLPETGARTASILKEFQFLSTALCLMLLLLSVRKKRR